MSKISIEGNASGTGTLTIAAPNTNTNYTLALPEEAGTITTSNSPYSTFRNRIINGDMRIDQRNAGASVSNGAAAYTYSVDRFSGYGTSASKFTMQQSTTAPTGFVNSTVVTSSAATTPGSGDAYGFLQRIEGTNVSDLAFGSASAKTVTISFWVRSSITGTYAVALTNSGYARCYPAEYTISAANTWEYKTVTIAGDTSGTWLTTTGIGAEVWFDLGSGSNFNGTANSWNGSLKVRTSSSANWIGTNGATFYITGVQLEVGSVATPFERRPYGQELSLCQRYFQRYTQNTAGIANDSGIAMLANWNTTSAYTALLFQQTMRAGPTVSFSSPSHFAVLSAGSSWTPDSLIVGGASINSTEFYADRNSASWTAGYSSWLRITNSAGYIQLSAEL
jgi:hypothetical protein